MEIKSCCAAQLKITDQPGLPSKTTRYRWHLLFIILQGLAGDDPVMSLERALYRNSASLLPSHYLMVDIKLRLAQLYGNCPPYSLDTMPRPCKERKVQVRQQISSSLA